MLLFQNLHQQFDIDSATDLSFPMAGNFNLLGNSINVGLSCLSNTAV
jgi:hypothetical protein